MNITLYNQNAQSINDNSLINDDVWKVIPHDQAVHDVIVAYLSAKRQATRKTKTRAEVAGGGRKPWAQKGTGKARQGSIRAPQWIKGGVVFGPTPDVNFHKKTNRKVYHLALKSVLSDKIIKNQVIFIDNLSLSIPKTSQMIAILKLFNLINKKVLFVTNNYDQNIEKSVNNIKRVNYLVAHKTNVYDILNYDWLVIDQLSVNYFENMVG